MSEPGPFGLRAPVSRALSRGGAVAVALVAVIVACVMAASDAFAHESVSLRIVAAASVLLLSAVGGVGGLVLATVGPWRVRAVAAIAFALVGAAGAVAFGLDVDGGPLAPAALVAVTAVVLVIHLLASPSLADEEA
ncbi:hypothetical protein [Agrococcus sp. GCM10030265]|uniref:hypothetical protein n=1 Tax=Agrococcus sp. GCM10030265 TaxID=3273378 RepID=UPI00366DD561